MTTAFTPRPQARIVGRGLHFGKTVEVIELHPRRGAGAVDAATVVLAEPGRPACRRVLSVGYLEPLPLPAVDGREWFDALAADYWVCPCGNSPSGAGLCTTARDGVEVDLDAAAWQRDGGCYRCADCGRIGALHERDALGRVPVIGRLDPQVLAEVDDDWQ